MTDVPITPDFQLPPKKPAHSEDFYLRARIRNLLCNIDQIVDPRIRAQVEERLRGLVRELRNSRGASFWPLIFASLTVCAFIVLAHPWAKTRVFCLSCTPQTSFRVLKSYNKRDFLMQRVVDGIPEPPEMRRFDEDSPLEQGFTLTYLKFEDRGSVWSVRGIDPYFRLEREDSGLPTVPKNCYHSYPGDVEHDHVVCNGIPKWEGK